MGRKFDDLSLEEKIAHFDDVAARALPLWAYPENADKKLLNYMENATYLVKAAGKETMIMRVHRPFRWKTASWWPPLRHRC